MSIRKDATKMKESTLALQEGRNIFWNILEDSCGRHCKEGFWETMATISKQIEGFGDGVICRCRRLGNCRFLCSFGCL
jgi:hypothetical protein